MPNWKTYESTIRLIAAVLAAHPELKLNYAGTFRNTFKHIQSIFAFTCVYLEDLRSVPSFSALV